jgi:hypothetical protein
MRRTPAAAIGVAVACGACATSAPAKLTKGRYPDKSTICMNLGSRLASEYFTNDELVGASKAFGDIDTDRKYSLRLRGIYQFTKRKDTNGKRVYFEHFYARRFAVQGATTVTATRHPKKKSPLTSTTELRVYSAGSNVTWSFGVPPSFSVTPADGDKTRVITHSVTKSRSTKVKSFVVRGRNALNGPAGAPNGIFKLIVKSSVQAGKGPGPYPVAESEWPVQDAYTSTEGGKLPGLGNCNPDINFDVY